MREIDFNKIDEEIRIVGDIPIKPHERNNQSIFQITYKKNDCISIEKFEQNHLLFSECKNYLDFYNNINEYYDDSEKPFIDGKSHWVSRKDIVSPLYFLNQSGIGNHQLKSSMEYFQYYNIDEIMKDKQYLCLSGETDSQKTTKLLSIVLSMMTEKKQESKFYSITQKNLFVVWDDIMNFDFWKNNEYILSSVYEYLFIDDMFNRDMSEWQTDNLITILRNSEKNGTKVIITTNVKRDKFFQKIRNLGESLYSRYNESRFKFVELSKKNHRINK